MPITQQIDNLLGGVSQAPDTVRDPSQAVEQVNMLSHRARGPRKRPPTEHVAKLTDVTTGVEEGFIHVLERSAAERYHIVVADGDLKAYDQSGVEQTVLFPKGKAYLGDIAVAGFRAVTVGDMMVLLNRGVSVAKDTASKTPDVTPQALLVVRQADYSATYTVTVDLVTKTLKLPGVGAAGADKSLDTTETAKAIKNAIGPYLGDAYTLTLYGSALHIQRVDGADFTVSSSDSKGSTALLTIKGTVQSFEMLPATAPTGFTVEVVGAPESDADNYFVQFDGTAWREILQPGLTSSFDVSTLPHTLAFSGEIISEERGQGTPKLPGVSATASDRTTLGWERYEPGSIAVSNQDADVSLYEHGASYVMDTALQIAASTYVVTVRYDIDTSYLSISDSVHVSLQYRDPPGAFAEIASATHWGGAETILTGQELVVSQAVAQNAELQVVLTYASGATPSDGVASLTLYGIPKLGLTFDGDRSKLITFDPEYMYPAGCPITVTVDAAPFTHTVGAADESGDAVAQALQAVIDADAGFAAVNGAAGELLVTRADATEPTAVPSLTFSEATTFHSPNLTLVPGEHVGRTVKNVTDGSSAVITANTATTVTVAALTGGGDNTFQPGDRMSIVGTGTYFVFSTPPWADRGAGDNDTCPFPSIVDRTIDEVFYYQGRLGMTTRENVVCSRAGAPFNLFRATATDLLVTDPIDIKSATRAVTKYHSALPWLGGVFLFSDSEAFRLSGSPVLSPQTVRLDPMGAHLSNAGVRPIDGGSHLFLFSVSHGFTRVAVASLTTTNEGEEALVSTDITNHVPAYLKGLPIAVACSQKLGVLCVLTDALSGVDGFTEERRAIYALSYSFQQSDGQLSWSRWEHGAKDMKLLALDIAGTDVGILAQYQDGLYLESMSLDADRFWPLLLGDGTAFGDGTWNGSGVPL